VVAGLTHWGVCLCCVPLSLGIGNRRKDSAKEGGNKCTIIKPGYNCYESIPSKLVFVVNVKAKTCMLTYFQYLDLIYDLLKWWFIHSKYIFFPGAFKTYADLWEGRARRFTSSDQ
jgi:hypothetical protein